MAVQVSGPAWSKPGLDIVGGRYPLRVEAHVGRLVQRLLPGVITTTYQARTFALHGLVWAEVARRQLELEAALELVRRCEVVLAAVSLQHEHGMPLPEPHGGDVIDKALAADGFLDVARLQQKGEYTQSQWGFAGAYLGSEVLLGIAGAGRPPAAGERVEQDLLHEALGRIMELAAKDVVEIAELAAHPELCICGARHAPDGEWLRRVFLAPPESEAIARSADEARRATARLLARVVEAGAAASLQEAFRRQVAFGDFLDADPVAAGIPLAHAWRGVILRNYSVGAWRRVWSWLVEQLSEPLTSRALGTLFADQLPEATVGEFVDALPTHVDDGVLLPIEEELRQQQSGPDPETELRLLALGALRLDGLDGRAREAFRGDPNENDLGPTWFRDRLERNREQTLRRFGAELAGELVRRAWRVAFSKMELRADGTIWFPSRIREREGLIFRQSAEGSSDVALRVDSLGSLLAGMGVLDRDDGGWHLTAEGEAILA